MSELLALAERCEKATVPGRDLDEAIDRAAFPQHWANEFFDPSRHDLPAYTASLDAAITLVPEGFMFTLYSDGVAGVAKCKGEDLPDGDTNASTPALALCAAALKARAQGSSQ